jgi:hypothetical protein
LLLAIGFACSTVARGAGEPIGFFDLTYALKIDAGDPAAVRGAWDACHAVATLQGIVNRAAPRLYVRFVSCGSTDVDAYWLEKYRRPGRWLADRPIVAYADIPALVDAYRGMLKGAVVYDPAVAATSNVASSVAGAEDLVAVRYDPAPGSLYARLVVEGPRLPVRVWLVEPDGRSKFTGAGTVPDIGKPSSGSAKGDAYVWLKERYLDARRCDPLYGGCYIDYFWTTMPRATILNHHTLTNHDFFVSKRGFFFDLSPWGDEAPNDDPRQPVGTDRRVLCELLLGAYRASGGKSIIHIGGFPAWAFKYTKHVGGAHDDVPTEWEYTALISAYNAFQDADAIGYGAMANASFWQHFPLKHKYPQRWVTPSELRERGYLDGDGKLSIAGRQFFIFYVGDYDAASWVYQRVPDLWDRPDRGKVPLMWCVSPVLDRRAPMALDYLRETATNNDYFAAADNGAGYLNPGMLQEPRPVSGLPSGLDAWAEHCAAYYRRWDLSITGFVIDGYAPGLSRDGLDCYARFSPNGIVPQKIPLTLLHGDMPVLRADWDVNQDDPAAAAGLILERIKARPLPFHWFRNILKPPSWHVAVYERVRAADARIELLDAPTFFELFRRYLREKGVDS